MIELIKASERLPADGKLVLLIRQDGPKLVVYDEYYKCWDDEYGDDYYSDIEPDDLWMDIPYPENKNGGKING